MTLKEWIALEDGKQYPQPYDYQKSKELWQKIEVYNLADRPSVDIQNRQGPTILTEGITPPGLLKNEKTPPGQMKKWFETPREFEEHCDSYTGSSWDAPERECYKPVPGRKLGIINRATVTMGLGALLFFLV